MQFSKQAAKLKSVLDYEKSRDTAKTLADTQHSIQTQTAALQTFNDQERLIQTTVQVRAAPRVCCRRPVSLTLYGCDVIEESLGRHTPPRLPCQLHGDTDSRVLLTTSLRGDDDRRRASH